MTVDPEQRRVFLIEHKVVNHHKAATNPNNATYWTEDCPRTAGLNPLHRPVVKNGNRQSRSVWLWARCPPDPQAERTR